jgi:hypothetical protein
VASDIVEAGITCKEKGDVEVLPIKKADGKEPAPMTCGPVRKIELEQS